MSNISHGWVRPSMDARIAAHVHVWEQITHGTGKHTHETFPFITLSREFGCPAVPLSHRLVELLNERLYPTQLWLAYDDELLQKVADELHLHRKIVESLDGRRHDQMTALFENILNLKVDESVIVRKLGIVIRSLALHGNAVIVGRGSHLITQDLKTGFHVRLVAPRDWRIARLTTDYDVTPAAARQMLDQGEHERENYMRTFFVQDLSHPFYHDLVIDVARFNLVQISEIIFTALGTRFGERFLAT